MKTKQLLFILIIIFIAAVSFDVYATILSQNLFWRLIFGIFLSIPGVFAIHKWAIE